MATVIVVSLRPPFALGPRVRSRDGAELATYDLGGTGPALLLVHATGFHGRCWLPVVPALRPFYHCFTFDLRGHGHSSESPDGGYHWQRFRDDTLDVVDALGLDHPYGVGHSWGAALLLLSAEQRPDALASLYCYEPVFSAPGTTLGVDRDLCRLLAARARRRRQVFESREAALARFLNKAPFDRFDPFASAAYADYGLVELTGGGVRLGCRGETEARTYEAVGAAPTFDRLPQVSSPVTLVCGSEHPDIGPDSLRAMAARLPSTQLETLDGLSHFGPLEKPNQVAASVLAAFGPTT